MAGLAFTLILVQWMLNWEHATIARSPEYVTWSVFASVGVVIYWHVFARTRVHINAPSRTAFVVSAIAYVIFAGLVLLLLTGRAPAGTLPWVMRPIYLVAEFCAAPAVLTLWLSRPRLQKIRLHGPGALNNLLTIRCDISRSLIGLSLIASTGLINTAVLRKAHIAHGLEPELFPVALILAYGGVLSGIVALIYIPAFLTWRDKATALVNTAYPVPKDAQPTEEWTDGRTRLTELISPENPITKTVGTALSILAPFATAVLAYYLPDLNQK
ncbi:hypothetical protein [Actinophytocola sp.]|uniref:hypothetical protein n=1 Tax=Actinophytocola sp. TaxID=1872138 RepID=UPI002ED457C1